MPNTFYFATEADLVFGGPASRAEGNLAAIRLLKKLEEEGRDASPEEQTVLSQYVGWGCTDVYNSRRLVLDRELSWEEKRFLDDSTNNAHFTALPVISAMWEGLLHLGLGNLRTIRALDPSAGSGNFFSMIPAGLRSRMQCVEIERDLLSASILKHLHPYIPGKSKVIHSAFEEAALPSEYFDLIITNVPFLNAPVVDRSVGKQLRRCFHDYFIAKGLTYLRPGGIQAIITSRYTLDKTEDEVRKWLAARADLLAAVRLPDTSFRANAGTEVVTDVLFFRKREEETAVVPDWVETVREDRGMHEWWVYNKIYSLHPDWLIGRPTSQGTQYREEEYTVSYDGEPGSEGDCLSAKLLETLPANLIAPEDVVRAPEPMIEMPAPAPAEIIPIPDYLPVDQKYRLEGLRQIYNIAKSILSKEANGAPESEVDELRAQLNEAYDRYVLGFGPINSKANSSLLKTNPAFPFLRALEVRKGDFDVEKAPIFSRSTVRPRWQQREVVSASDALYVCLDITGKVDMGRIAALAKMPVEKAIQELRGMVYRRPDGIWETADKYLSGNILEKLQQAEVAYELDPTFENNVQALREAMPPALKPGEIKARLGAGWIPANDIKTFIRDLLPCNYVRMDVAYVASLGTWTVECRDKSNLPDYEMFTKWGTGRMNALEIIEAGLNSRTPLIYDEVDDKRVLNKVATMAAQAKLEEIKARFETWVWEDSERAERLAAIYNERYNAFRRPRFDGSYLSLPGLSTAMELRKHQLDGVARCLQSSTTLLGHEVGLGKTLTSSVSVMEMIRLGLAHKALVAVPNHLTEQWRDEILKAYPGANVLCAGKDDLSKFKRGEFLSRIATGDWHFVIVPMSSNKLLPVGLEFQKKFIDAELDKLRAYLEELKEDNAPRTAIKEVNKAIKRYEAKLDNLANMRKDSAATITWEQLGIDALVVDEFHNYKNLYFHTKMNRIAGLPNTNSERAFDMFMKVRCILENGGRFIGCTATPVSNTLAEIYTMQRYFQYDTLENLGLAHFDAWESMFADVVMLPEMTPDGAGFRINTRLAKYTNVPELSTLLAQFCDVRTWAELGNISVVSRPHLYGGKSCVVKLPANAVLKAFTQQFAERAEKIHGGGVDPREDNMLKITSDGRKAALDLRLLTSQIPDSALPMTKSQAAAEVIAHIWKETEKHRSAQLVFCDLGTPSMDGLQSETALPEGVEFELSPVTDEEKAAFENVYADLKAKLTAQGVKPEEIAFIHDATSPEKRTALFEAVNRGRVRVLVGSTEKMGTGMNVQERLIAVHHLDAPWRPSDIEQRVGRMLRQGNLYPEVFVITYITESSFDGYCWQVLETKARFIWQIMSGQCTSREVEDVSETVLSMAEIKALASGNPKVLDRVKLQNEISKLEHLYHAWLDNRAEMRRRINRHGFELQKSAETITFYEQAIQARDAHPVGDDFKMTVRGTVYTERKAAGEAINRAAEALIKISNIPSQETRAEVGEYRGFKIILKYFRRIYSSTELILPSLVSFMTVDILLDWGYIKPLPANIGESGLGTVQSIETALRNLDSNKKKELEHKEFLIKQQETLTAGLQEGWEHEARFEKAKADLLRVDKELLGEGVELPGMAAPAPNAVSVDLDAAPAAEEDKPSVESEPATDPSEDLFDMEKIVLRIREILAALPAEASEELIEVQAPITIAMQTGIVDSSSSGPTLSWTEWLGKYNLAPATRAGGRRKVKVEEGQLALF